MLACSADAHRARLDAQIPGDHQSPGEARPRQAYLDGELYGVGPDGITIFNIVQLASDSGNVAALVFFLFDLLHLDGKDLRRRPLIERRERLRTLLVNAIGPHPAKKLPLPVCVASADTSAILRGRALCPPDLM
jgi:ATP-dependent DNA ligase